jgi:hypothetical protein
MAQYPGQGAVASGFYDGDDSPEPRYETLRHEVYGSLGAVQANIRLLHSLHYADPNDWSRPVATGKPNEFVAIMHRRVRVF